MVFFCCWLQISFASDDMRWINSVQQLRINSRESFATRIFGRISLIILLIEARGRVSSSSSFADIEPEDAILTEQRFRRIMLSDWQNNNLEHNLFFSRPLSPTSWNNVMHIHNCSYLYLHNFLVKTRQVLLNVALRFLIHAASCAIFYICSKGN